MCVVLQVIRMKGALNEKEMELIELREQHMQLVVSIDATSICQGPGTLCSPCLSLPLASSRCQQCALAPFTRTIHSFQKPLPHCQQLLQGPCGITLVHMGCGYSPYRRLAMPFRLCSHAPF